MRRAKFIVLMAVLFSSAASVQGQLKDLDIGSRVLTDADMEKYVAVTREVTKVTRALKGDTSPGAVQKIQQATRSASEPLGWGTLDYSVVNARVTTALLALRMEKQTPVPADKKADVELVRKWKDKIDQAKKM
jgi:hypothetical protein